mmetsp:Transcript_4537/g.5090  ORF Transcript_4537/g.5090 Transcript_4537/m.5090 type:complete len:239 (+) Transcript_4537:348-1064(+)
MNNCYGQEPHDPIVQLPGVEDVYYVHGDHYYMPIMKMNRNMVIIKEGSDLSLINPIKLTTEGEEELLKLGTIKRIIRLGFWHGSDDEYYKKTFNVPLWAPGASTVYPDIEIDVKFTEDDELFPGSKTVIFDKDLKLGAEAVFTYKGVLFTCDCIQYHSSYTRCNLMGKMMLPMLGLKGLVIANPWMEATQLPEGKSVKPDFERIMELDFDQFISAHGHCYERGAKDAVRAAIDTQFQS